MTSGDTPQKKVNEELFDNGDTISLSDEGNQLDPVSQMAYLKSKKGAIDLPLRSLSQAQEELEKRRLEIRQLMNQVTTLHPIDS